MRGNLRQAFTLIELLTVIAIIALLAAILFPVFGRVRESVRQSTCMSNLHSIYVAVGQYKLDHSGEYPTMLLGAAETQGGLPWLSGNGTAVEAKSIQHGFLFKQYINDITVFHCPDDPVNDQTVTAAPTYPASSTFFDFYGGQQPTFNVNTTNPTQMKLGFPYPTLTANYSGQPITYYAYDSYDMTCLPTQKTVYEVTYNRDWTGQIQTKDAPYQMKYPNCPGEKTVITFCNYHSAVAAGNMSPVLLASGTCKPYNTLKVQQFDWTLTSGP